MKYSKLYLAQNGISLLLVISSIFFTSCSKEWFDEKSDKLTVVPESVADFQKLMDAPLMFQQNPVLGENASDLHYLEDTRYQSFSKGASLDAYIWSHTTRHERVPDWTTAYSKVLVDNIVLEGLEKIEQGSAASGDWKTVKGHALFNRARIFFDLAVTYAPAYNKATAAADLGVILRVRSDLTFPAERSSVEKTFELILRDLNEAYQLLPQNATMLTRPSKTATAFLLARVYLYMGNYEEALKHINLCLAQNATLLDFSKIPASSSFIGRYNTEVVLHSNFLDAVFSRALVEKSFHDQFHADDLRKTVFYRTALSTGNITFKGHYESSATNPFNGFATDEAYLIQAECYARLQKISEAMRSLNTLLKSRWSKSAVYIDLTAGTEEEALQLIFTERKKELNYRGVRWMDLKRLNRDPRFAQTITRQVLGQTYTLEPNSYKYSFPIPDDVLDFGNVKQNSGWDK